MRAHLPNDRYARIRGEITGVTHSFVTFAMYVYADTPGLHDELLLLQRLHDSPRDGGVPVVVDVNSIGFEHVLVDDVRVGQ